MWCRDHMRHGLTEDAESHFDSAESVEPRESFSSPESKCVTRFGCTWGCRRTSRNKKYLHRTGSSDTGFMRAFCSCTPRWNTLKGWNEPRGLYLAMVTDSAAHCGDKGNIFVICSVTSLFAIIQNFPHFGKGWICIARWKSWESEIFWGEYSQ